MPNRERRKGLDGEREVAAIFRESGRAVRNLDGGGDLLVLEDGGWPTVRPALHIEVKRCETARPWAWMAQAESEAPVGTTPVVAFRKSRSKWYALIGLEDLARLLA
jgi:Holliday junction resolvase